MHAYVAIVVEGRVRSTQLERQIDFPKRCVHLAASKRRLTAVYMYYPSVLCLSKQLYPPGCPSILTAVYVYLALALSALNSASVSCSHAPKPQQGHPRAVEPAQAEPLQHADKHPKRLFLVRVHLQQGSTHEIHALHLCVGGKGNVQNKHGGSILHLRMARRERRAWARKVLRRFAR